MATVYREMEEVDFQQGIKLAGVLVTADAAEGANGAARTAAQIVKRLLEGPGGVPSGDIDAGAVAALDALNASVLGFYADREASLGDALDRVLASIGGYLTVGASGLFTVGRLDAPGVSAVRAFTVHDILSIERVSPADPGRGVPVKRVTARYAPNFTPQADADLAGAVTLTRRQFVKEAYRAVTSEDGSVATAHLLAGEIALETLLADEADAGDEADRVLALRKVRRDLLRVSIADPAPEAELGATIALKMARFGMGAGRNFVVTSRSEELSRGGVVLEVFG